MGTDTTALGRTDRATIATRLDDEEAVLGPRIAALERTVAELIESGLETNVDDEHDPDGVTIGFERSQAQALLDRARNDLDTVAEASGWPATPPSGPARSAAVRSASSASWPEAPRPIAATELLPLPCQWPAAPTGRVTGSR